MPYQSQAEIYHQFTSIWIDFSVRQETDFVKKSVAD